MGYIGIDRVYSTFFLPLILYYMTDKILKIHVYATAARR